MTADTAEEARLTPEATSSKKTFCFERDDSTQTTQKTRLRRRLPTKKRRRRRRRERQRERKKQRRRRRRRRRRMPLANKEVVHLKHGWEKIQVGTTRDDDDDARFSFFSFSFFRVLERATLRTHHHHHHHHFLNRISKSAASCSFRAQTDEMHSPFSLSLSLSATTTTNQTGIDKLKNLLDNKNGANGEEPQGFDATEFMGHYT